MPSGERVPNGQNMSIIFFTLGLLIMFSITIVIAQEGILDGKNFVGQYRELSKKMNLGFSMATFIRSLMVKEALIKEFIKL
jgi:hypothetical protein